MAKNKKRADGRYSCQVYLGKGPDGKRKYKTFYGSTLREAKAAADDFRAAVSKGMDPEQAEATLGTLYDNLIAAKKAKGIGQKSIDRPRPDGPQRHLGHAWHLYRPRQKIQEEENKPSGHLPQKVLYTVRLTCFLPFLTCILTCISKKLSGKLGQLAPTFPSKGYLPAKQKSPKSQARSHFSGILLWSY